MRRLIHTAAALALTAAPVLGVLAAVHPDGAMADNGVINSNEGGVISTNVVILADNGVISTDGVVILADNGVISANNGGISSNA
jgi:hypothetical protein